MISVIISPAKQIRLEDFSPLPPTEPQLLARANELYAWLRTLSCGEAKALWACGDKLAAQAYEQLHRYDTGRGLGCALLSYDGIQYKYMAPAVFSDRAFGYAADRLRIVSGLYGLLRPSDMIVPYRLEMQARLRAPFARDLYEFWGADIADAIEGDTVIDLASGEYSRAVLPHLKGRRAVKCIFAERAGDKLIEKGVYVKMARGRMVSFMAENGVERPEELRYFDDPDYEFSPADSADDILVFIRRDKRKEAGR